MFAWLQLVKKLHTVNEGLKKFAHVNKKAFEQYNNFTKQRDQLIQRREDLDKSAKSIEELVEVLDQRECRVHSTTTSTRARNVLVYFFDHPSHSGSNQSMFYKWTRAEDIPGSDVAEVAYNQWNETWYYSGNACTQW